MREILFKGKRKNDEWVEGSLIRQIVKEVEDDNKNQRVSVVKDKYYIAELETYTEVECRGCATNIIVHQPKWEVDPETVCQYTGLKDKNGKKIWEGDIVRFEGYGYMPEVETGEVVFSRGCFGVEYLSKLYKALGHNDKSFHRIGKTSKWTDMGASGIITYTYEVLGDKFDNPELLGVTE